MPHLASLPNSLPTQATLEPVQNWDRVGTSIVRTPFLSGGRRVPSEGISLSSFSVALQAPLEPVQNWDRVGTSTIRVPLAEIRWLEQLYSFRNRAEVLRFLDEYPFLVSLLLEAPDKIRRYFPGSQLLLELITNPEVEEIDDNQLLVSITTNLEPDEAVKRLEQFDDGWWLDTLDQVHGKLCIDVEFQ